MKKQAIGVTMALLLASTACWAAVPDDKLDFSVEHWEKHGLFDYSLHYGDTSQLLSKVSAPQNQAMDIYKLQYKPDAKHFVRLQYGATRTGINGHGDDSDWTIYGSPEVLTDYGTMNFHGKETLYSIDLGKYLAKNANHTTNFFIGWGNEKTFNEIKDVVYHKSYGVDIGNAGQADNGSYLNGDFGGAHVGLESDYAINPKIGITTSVVLKHGEANAYGHWANHVPAWNWVNKGETWGYDVKAGLNCKLGKHTAAALGYYYSHAKAYRTDETMDDGSQITELPGIADLTYTKHGYYFSLQHKF